MDAEDSVVPPLLVCDADPLDIAMELRRIHGDKQQIIIVAELNEFDSAGDIDLKNPACMSPASLHLRTNFQSFLREAKTSLRDGAATDLHSHLSAIRDPYVFYCNDVCVFRGSRDDGYPFLPEPMYVDVIATAASCMRPSLNIRRSQKTDKHVEWFAHEEDHYALLDRLHLLGLVGLSQAYSNFSHGGGEEQPILVLGTLWCGGGRSGRLPRHACAEALRGWSEVFCRLFRSVFVCCGGEEARSHDKLAQLLDRVANLSTYAAAFRWQWHMIPPVMKWHWNAEEIKLAKNPEKLERAFMAFEGHKAKHPELRERAAVVGMDLPDLPLVAKDEEAEKGMSLEICVSTSPLASVQLALSANARSPDSPQPRLSSLRSSMRLSGEVFVETQQHVLEEVLRFSHNDEAHHHLQPSKSLSPHAMKPIETWRHSMVLGDVLEEMHHPGQTMLSPRVATAVAGNTSPTAAVQPPGTPSPRKRRQAYFSKATGSKSFTQSKLRVQNPPPGDLDSDEIDDLIASANKEFDIITRPISNLHEHKEPPTPAARKPMTLDQPLLGAKEGSESKRASKKASSQAKRQKKQKSHQSHPLRLVKPHFYRNNPNESLDAIRRKVCEKVVIAMEEAAAEGRDQASTVFERYALADDSEEEEERAEAPTRCLSSQEKARTGRRTSDFGSLAASDYCF
jgi:hypothetical protein